MDCQKYFNSYFDIIFLDKVFSQKYFDHNTNILIFCCFFTFYIAFMIGILNFHAPEYLHSVMFS